MRRSIRPSDTSRSAATAGPQRSSGPGASDGPGLFRRPGTAAALLPDNAERSEIQNRFDRLVNLANDISARRHAQCEGKSYEVLIDGVSPSGDYNLTSRTPGGRLVHLRGGEELIGSFRRVCITGSNTYSLFGEFTEEA